MTEQIQQPDPVAVIGHALQEVLDQRDNPDAAEAARRAQVETAVDAALAGRPDADDQELRQTLKDRALAALATADQDAAAAQAAADHAADLERQAAEAQRWEGHTHAWPDQPDEHGLLTCTECEQVLPVDIVRPPVEEVAP